MLPIYTLSAQPVFGESGLLRPWLQPWLPWVDFADRHVATAAHFTRYAALAWAWLAALSTTPRPPARVAPARVAPAQVALAAWLLAALYGIPDEWHQLHVPGRCADVHDLPTNTVGAATAALLWLHNARRRLTG